MKKIYIFCLILLGCVSFGIQEANALVPMIEDGKEWGYCGRLLIPTYDNRGIENMCFYRLRFSGTEEINGKTYNKLYFIDSISDQQGKLYGYMREDEGKVYVIYSDCYDFDFNHQWNYFGRDNNTEFLLYDFNMEPGDIMTILPGPESDEYIEIEIKCVETGEIDTEQGSRKFIKLAKCDNSIYGDWYRQFEYLIEGIGPVGNVDFFMPYHYDMRSHFPSENQDTDLLYVRTVTMQGNGIVTPDKMLYYAPQYEVYGMYDPALWFLGENNPDWKRLPTPNFQIGCPLWPSQFACVDEEITKLEIFDTIGRLVFESEPNSRTTAINQTHCGDNDYVIVRLSNDSGSRSFKQNWR